MDIEFVFFKLFIALFKADLKEIKLLILRFKIAKELLKKGSIKSNSEIANIALRGEAYGICPRFH